MPYVKTDGGTTVVQYPYPIEQIRKDNPNVSFPDDLSVMADFSDWDVFPVTEVAKPDPVNPDQVVDEGDPVFTTEWTQNWIERAPTQSEFNAAYIQKRRAIRAEFGERIDNAAIAAGFDQSDIDLINSVATFNAAVMSYLLADNSLPFRQNVASLRQHAKTLLQSASAATTLSQIAAIDETAGWPV